MLGFVWIGGTDLFLKGIVRITNKRNFHRRIWSQKVSLFFLRLSLKALKADFC